VLGLEAAAVSHRLMTIASLEPDVDPRRIDIQVATPAALVVAKTYKIGERSETGAHRLLDKDAHDLYRLLRAGTLDDIRIGLETLLVDEVAGTVMSQALTWLADLSRDVDAVVPQMAGRAEEIVGDPEDVAQVTWGLVQDLLEPMGR
jgi:hypothetical protein